MCVNSNDIFINKIIQQMKQFPVRDTGITILAYISETANHPAAGCWRPCQKKLLFPDMLLIYGGASWAS